MAVSNEDLTRGVETKAEQVVRLSFKICSMLSIKLKP